MLNIMQRQCIVLGRPCGLLSYIFHIQTCLLVRGLQFGKTGLENLRHFLYLCIFRFWIFITASNYQLYRFLNNILFL